MKVQPGRAERGLRVPESSVGVAGDVRPQQRGRGRGQQELAAGGLLAQELREILRAV